MLIDFRFSLFIMVLATAMFYIKTFDFFISFKIFIDYNKYTIFQLCYIVIIGL